MFTVHFDNCKNIMQVALLNVLQLMGIAGGAGLLGIFMLVCGFFSPGTQSGLGHHFTTLCVCVCVCREP